MATSSDFIEFVADQVDGTGDIRYRKMFGEYMIYVNDKPILLVCNNTVYIKMREEIAHLMAGVEKAYPYEGAKEHYILDIDNGELAREIIRILEPITPLPKPKKKKSS